MGIPRTPDHVVRHRFRLERHHALAALAALLLVASGRSGSAAAAPQRWEIISNANEVRGVTLHQNRLYAATGGGVVAWDFRTGALLRKWTSIDGPQGNRAYAIATCPMPQPTLVVGTSTGLSLYDIASQKWRSLTSYNSGLTAGNVTALASDPSRQILYVGHSYAGLDVFEAKRKAWRHFATVNGLPANKITGIAVSPVGDQVWIACPTGAAVLSGQNLTAWKMPQIGVVGELTGAVAVDPAGAAWFVASEGSLLRNVGKKWTIYGPSRLGGSPLLPAAGLATSRDGSVWCVNARGQICRFDPATERCTPGQVVHGVTGLLEGPTGTMLVATDSGIRTIAAGRDGPSFTVAGDVIGSNHIVALAEDQSGTVWIATTAGTFKLGAGRASGNLTPVKAAETIGPGQVRTLYADPRGGMWFGTTAGAASFDGSVWRRLGRRDGLVGDTVQAIVRDGGGRMWIGTNRGISVWDGTRVRNITARDGLRSQDVHSLFARGDVVWAGTREFMFRFERGQLEFLDDEVMGVEFETMRMISAHGRDSLILGTTNGLAYIDGRTGRDDPEIYGDAVGGIAIGRSGDLWVGTEVRGLFHRVGGTWTNLTIADGLPSNFVTALLLDRGGRLWVGTSDAGLARSRP